jgi:hypothetical protein
LHMEAARFSTAARVRWFFVRTLLRVALVVSFAWRTFR